MVRHASEHDARLTDLSSVSLLAGEGGNKKKNLFLHASFSPSGRSRPLFLISQGQWRSRRFQKELELTSSSSSSHTWQGGGPRWAEGLQISPTLTSVSLSILIRHRLSSCSETLKLTDQLRHSKKKIKINWSLALTQHKTLKAWKPRKINQVRTSSDVRHAQLRVLSFCVWLFVPFNQRSFFLDNSLEPQHSRSLPETHLFAEEKNK